MQPTTREAYSESAQVLTPSATLAGDLEVPAGATGIVLFAHGSGSSRHSPRNRLVAAKLQEAGLGTLLLDLLTPDEEAEDRENGQLRFNVHLLADRLADATVWLRRQPATRGLPVGYFGASTGAAAALLAAAKTRESIKAIVSRGGRPDLAGPMLRRVRCPTLLLVGGNDGPVIGMNQDALRRLAAADKQLVIIPGAGHLFEEPGTLEEVARLAADWFVNHFAALPAITDDERLPLRYRNREEAGRYLARSLKNYAGQDDVLVLALPRGGVPIGFEVAQALHAPLDVVLVRKLGVPGEEELAMGAIASGGVRIVNEAVVGRGNIPPEALDAVAEREEAELRRREQAYRGDRPPIQVAGKTILLVDDGLATGSTMRAAVTALRHLRPHKIVVAVPVGPPDVCELMRAEADEVVCLRTPAYFAAVGRWYEDFGQTTDDEVRDLLARAKSLGADERRGLSPPCAPPG